MGFILPFAVGALIGALVGMFAMALASAGKYEPDENEDKEEDE